MWVRSQDRKSLINCNEFYIVALFKIGYAINCKTSTIVCELGNYSTQEKAMKVLNMIEDCIKDTIEKGRYDPAVDFYERGVFKMPLDSEL